MYNMSDGILNSVTVKVPATSANCGAGFDVLGMALNLYNEFTLSFDTNQTSIKVEGFGQSMMQNDPETNLCVISIRKLLQTLGINKPYMQIEMKNNIPLSRGLGSSSAAIVASITSANALLGNKLSKDDLLNIATKIEGHPDNVAPAIYGGLTISIMQEDKPKTLVVKPPENLQMIVIIPNLKLSTKSAREVLPQTINHKDAVFNVGRVALFVACMCSGDISFLASSLEDKLHQPYRSKLIPAIDEIFYVAKEKGAIGSIISGSGSTLLAFADKNSCGKSIGINMCQKFQDNNIDAVYKILDFDLKGTTII